MPFDYFAAYGQSHAGSSVFLTTMQPVEWLEYAFGKLPVESNPVVLYKDLASLSIMFCMDLDSRTLVASVFQSVSNQVLKETQHLGFIGLDAGHVSDLNQAA